MLQWLRLRAPNAGGPGLTPGQGARFRMPQLKIPHTATKTPCSQNKYFKKIKNKKIKKLTSQKGGKYPLQATYERTLKVLVIL